MTESSDAIARRFRANDATAFAAVYDRYRGLIHAVAVMELADPAEAEDVTQEVFRRAFAAADQLEDPVQAAAHFRGFPGLQGEAGEAREAPDLVV